MGDFWFSLVEMFATYKIAGTDSLAMIEHIHS